METNYTVPHIDEETMLDSKKLEEFLAKCETNGVPETLVSLLICAYSHKVANKEGGKQ